MNDSNHAVSRDTVDHVFAGLRDIEAPTGMDQRILAAMHQRAAANTSPARSSILATPLFWLAATAAAMAVTSTASTPVTVTSTASTPVTVTSTAAAVSVTSTAAAVSVTAVSDKL